MSVPLALLLCAGWLVVRRTSAPPDGSQEYTRVASPVAQVGADPTSRAELEGAPTPERQPHQPERTPPALAWCFHDGEAAPTPNVLLSITEAALVDGSLEWWELDEDALALQAIEVRSDEHGCAHISPHDGGRGPFVCSATRAGIAARHIGHFPASRLPGRLEVELEAAPPLEVTVLGMGGEPVAAARVAGFSLAPSESLPSEGSSGHWIVRREGTGSDGRAFLSRTGGPMVLYAEAGALRSKPWRGTPGAHVELRLDPTFAARGGALPLAQPEQARVTVRVDPWNFEHVLSGVGLEGGRWRMEEIPVLEGRTYIFRLESPGLVPQEVRHPCPPAGADLVVEFEQVPGVELVVRVVDASGEPLEGVGVQLLWDERGMLEWVQLHARTDAGGRAHFREACRGYAYVRLRHDRWSHIIPYGPYDLPLEAGEIEILAHAAGSVHGRCTHRGAPLTDFDITLWQASGQSVVHEIRDAVDGRFALGGVTLGEIRVSATSRLLPQSELELVLVAEETPAWVELELEDPIAVQGRVLDLVTFAPLTDASVQVCAVGPLGSRPWGDRHATASDGRFSGVPASPHSNVLRITATGYEEKVVRVPGHGSVVDVGTVMLAKPQMLEVRLMGPSADEMKSYQIEGRGPGALPRKPFGPDGLVRYKDVQPGSRMIQLVRDGYVEQIVTPDLVPGTAWVLELRAQSGRSLQIDVRPPTGEELPSSLWLCTKYWTSDGSPGQYWTRPDGDGRALMEWVFGERAVVEAMLNDHDGLVPLAEARVERPTGGEGYVELDLDRPSRRLRVLDANGKPLAGVRCSVADASYLESASYHSGTSNRDGDVLLPGGDAVTCFVSAMREDLGLGGDLEPEWLDEGSGFVRFVPSRSLAVRVADRGTPIAGARVDIVGSVTGLTFSKEESGIDGLAHFRSLDPASRAYVTTKRSDLWSPDVPVEGTGEVLLDVRRRGSLVLQVTLAQELRSGCRFHLRSVDFQEEAADWFVAGRISASESQLMTGAAGSLRIDGLPNGEYAWKLWLPDGSSREGPIRVPPHGLVELKVAQ